MLAVLAVFVQVLVPHKFIGWAVMLVYIVAAIALSAPRLRAQPVQLRRHAAGAAVRHERHGPLLDRPGLVPGLLGGVRLDARGARLRAVAARHDGGAAPAPAPCRAACAAARCALAGARAVWPAAARFIFYNTNVLNRYVTAARRDDRLRPIYEKALLPFEKVPQPRVTDGHAGRRALPARGARRHARPLHAGRTAAAQPIAELHLHVGRDLKLDSVDARRRHGSHATTRVSTTASTSSTTPMQPGEQRTLAFTTTLAERGFANGAPLTRWCPTARFVDNFEIAPAIGIVARGPARRTAPSAASTACRPNCGRPSWRTNRAARSTSSARDSDWVDADITVTTDADQTPIAPGYTVERHHATGGAPHGALPDRRADQPLLLDPVGRYAQRDGGSPARPAGTTSTWPSTTTPATTTTSTACSTR